MTLRAKQKRRQPAHRLTLQSVTATNGERVFLCRDCLGGFQYTTSGDPTDCADRADHFHEMYMAGCEAAMRI